MSRVGQLNSGATIVKAAAGTLTLATANTFTGGMSISAGQLNLGNAGALGTGTTFVISGGGFDNTLRRLRSPSRRTTHVQTIAGSFTFAGTNALNMGTGSATTSIAAPPQSP